MNGQWWFILLIIVSCYVIGSLPTGFIAGKLKGIDIRKVGSGNMGATNVVRTLGWLPGILVLLVDMAKGFACAYWMSGLTAYPESDLIKVACGLAAVIGHTFTLFLKFKGGKGVATAAGVFLGLAPISAALVLLIFVSVVAVTRYISAGSILAALFLPFLIWIVGEVGQGYSVFIIALLLAAMILVRHRSNIDRIIKGTENKLGQRVKTDQGETS